MHSGLSIGATAELLWQVSSEHVIHLGYPPPSLTTGLVDGTLQNPSASAVVFSTPNMILLMERTARKVLAPFLEPGEESVGALVNVEHLAGTPLGSQVRGVAKVTQIDGKAVDFEIAAYDRFEQIGRGTHRRVVVKLDRIARRIAEKAEFLSKEAPPLTWVDGIAKPDASEIHSVNSAIGKSMSPAEISPPQFETLLLEVNGSVATVTMNRPQKLNAVNRQMTSDWEALNRFLWGREDIRVVVLCGAGASFCAGDDVPEVGTLAIEEARELSYRQARAYLGWEHLPQVFIAAIDGVALGAGCVVACACDLRIASHNSRLGMPEILLGWPPGYGIAQLMALIGKSRATEMCLLGQPITAQKALEWGLVHRLTSSGSLLVEAKRWATDLLRLSPAALRETKRLMHMDEGIQPKTAFLADTAAYIRCLANPDAQEGIAAFREKRNAKFSGGS